MGGFLEQPIQNAGLDSQANIFLDLVGVHFPHFCFLLGDECCYLKDPKHRPRECLVKGRSLLFSSL